MTDPAEFDADGRLISARYGDVYFAGDGSGETHHVFLNGNDLPRRFEQADGTFVVAETGFGTGRNFLLTADEFMRRAPAGGRLVYVSIEQDVLDTETLARVHARLADAHHERAAQLRTALAGEVRSRIEFDGGRVVLCLLRGDVEAVLGAWTFEADAWFLDGFAPAKNPAMWTPSVLREVSRRTRPGGTFATYSAAGAVRRALEDGGFAVERADGFGGKREMLRGTLPNSGADAAPVVAPGTVQVSGAGIAGAAVAHAFAERGVCVTVVDPVGVASGASGIPAAVVRPRLWATDHGAVPDAEIVANAFRYTTAWLEWLASPRFRRCGALLVASEDTAARDARRTENPATSDLVEWVDAERAHDLSGLPVAPHGAVWIPDAGVLDVGGLVRDLLEHPNIEVRTGAPSNDPDLRVFATGTVGRLAGDLVTTPPVRGQAIALAGSDALAKLRTVLCTTGYLAPPDAEGLSWLGSTYDRLDESTEPRPDDDARVLEHFGARGALAEALDGARVERRFVGVRWTTSDRIPALGSLSGDRDVPTMVSLAHGSRGAVTAPWTAEVLTTRAFGEPAPAAPDHLRRLSAEVAIRRRRAAQHR